MASLGRIGIGGLTLLLGGCSVLLNFDEAGDSEAADAGLPDTPSTPDAAPPDVAVDTPPPPPDAMQLACDQGGINIEDPITLHCYMIFDVAETWEAAGASCTGLGNGAHLLTITSSEENALLGPSLGLAHRWMNDTDVGTEGTWRWANAEPWIYTNWRTGEPNNGGGIENCGVIEGNTGALWDDRACANAYGFICERDTNTVP